MKPSTQIIGLLDRPTGDEKGTLQLLLDTPLGRLLPAERARHWAFAQDPEIISSLARILYAQLLEGQREPAGAFFLALSYLLELEGFEASVFPGVSSDRDPPDRGWTSYVKRLIRTRADAQLVQRVGLDWIRPRDSFGGIGTTVALEYVGRNATPVFQPHDAGIDPQLARKIARCYWQPRLEDGITSCRQGDVNRAQWLVELPGLLGFSYADLGTTEEEVAEWWRQDRIRHVRSKFWDRADDHTLYLNVYGALITMVRHGLSPEDVGITRERFIAARDRLRRWLALVWPRPEDYMGGYPNPSDRGRLRRSIREFEETVFPLFAQVLGEEQPTGTQ